MTTENKFLFSYKQAIKAGIDYREFKKVKKLPTNCELTAIAGVWGNYQDLRCLFITGEGEKYCRTTYHRSKYHIPEISSYAKEINVGEKFISQQKLK